MNEVLHTLDVDGFRAGFYKVNYDPAREQFSFFPEDGRRPVMKFDKRELVEMFQDAHMRGISPQEQKLISECLIRARAIHASPTGTTETAASGSRRLLVLCE